MAAKKGRNALLSFVSLRELVFFLALLDKFLGLKLGRVIPLLEAVRSEGTETYSRDCGEPKARKVSLVLLTRKTGKKLPTGICRIFLYLYDQNEQGLEIEGRVSFLHSQKLSTAFKVFHQKTSDFEAGEKFQRLLVSVHSAVLAYMEEYPDAQSFAEKIHASLKKEIDGEDDLPF